MAAQLQLPSRLQKHSLFKEFDRFLREHEDLPPLVEVDFSRVQFIKPPSVAFLSNMSHWFHSMDSEVRFVGLDPSREAIRYLDDSLFFDQHIGKKLRSDSACRPTTVPVRQVAKRDSHSWLECDFIPWLAEKSGLTKSSLAEVKACLQELFNNISDHTDFEEGCIFGQWYPNIDEIVISVADFGAGIPTTVRRVTPDVSDSAAIVKAVEDGFSSKSLPTNRGAGLYLLLLNIVVRFNGTVTIRSGHGYARFVNDNGNIYSTGEQNCGYCIGTTIDIVLDTKQIPHTGEEEDFEW